MFWACFSWEHIGPCYIWPPESPEMKAKYKAIMEEWNKAHEAEHKAVWIEVETA
jgi:hypothetical protein